MNPRWIFDYREAPWHHDYPFAEHLYFAFLKEVTGVHTSPESYQIVRLDSADTFKYPFLYFSEPGYMELTPKEGNNLASISNAAASRCSMTFEAGRSTISDSK